MSFLICEGYNDSIFLSAVGEFHFQVKCHITNINIIDHYETIRSYKYLKKEFTFFIFSDNGKYEIINRITHRLLYDSFNSYKLEKQISFLTVLDDDSNPNHDKMSENIFNAIKNDLKSNNKTLNADIKINEELVIISHKDADIKSYLYLTFVDISLEYQLYEKASLKYDQLKKEKQRLESLEIHLRLNECITLLGLTTMADLIIKSIHEQWFNSDKWFQDILDKMQKIINKSIKPYSA